MIDTTHQQRLKAYHMNHPQMGLIQKNDRRKEIVQYLYDYFTENGSNLSCLAPLIFDGRIDMISHYVLHLDEYETETCTDVDNNNTNICDTFDKMNFDIKFDENNTSNSVPVSSSMPYKLSIDRIHCKDLSYEDFVIQYMKPNRPVIILGLTENWTAREHWVIDQKHKNTENGNGIDPDKVNDTHVQSTSSGNYVPNLDYIQHQFGSSTSPVFEQVGSGFSGERSKCKEQMTISDYINWWKMRYDNEDNGIKSSCFDSMREGEDQSNVRKQRHTIDKDTFRANNDTNDDATDDNIHGSSDTVASQDNFASPDKLLYLKDWKFIVDYPNYNAYEWRSYFRDDWLNHAMGDAYKFVYLGPKGTTTSLHADVIKSYSWSTNLCGTKRWYLIPPQYTYLLYDTLIYGCNRLATNIHMDVDYPNIRSFYPGLQYVRDHHSIEIIQHSNETIFIPSNWYHTVENLQPTLSINHNWLNACNIQLCCLHIEAQLLKSHDSIHTTRNTQNECQQGENMIHTEYLSEDKDINLNQSISDNSQVDDDLLLLWYIISNKANELIDTYRKHSMSFEAVVLSYRSAKNHVGVYSHRKIPSLSSTMSVASDFEIDLNSIQYVLNRLQWINDHRASPALLNNSESIRQLQKTIFKII